MSDTRRQHERLQVKATRVSMILSIILFLVSLAAGLVSDSVAMLLDASAGFVIVFMAFMLHSSIRKINLPPDRLFNFGYEKYEPFTVVIEGAMIMLSCVIAVKFALQDIIHPESVVRYEIPMLASFVSAALTMINALHLKIVSRKTGSFMLKTSGLHWMMDSLLSFAMCLGFAFGFYAPQLGFSHIEPYIDPVMALMLAALFIWMPLKAMKLSLRELLDAAPIKEIREEIEKVIERHKAKAFGIYNVQMRQAGGKVFVYVCFLIQGHTTMAQAQEFAESFEKDIAARFPKYHTIVYFYPAR